MAPHRIETGASIVERVQFVASKAPTGAAVSAGGVTAPAWMDGIAQYNGLLSTISVSIGILVGLTVLVVQIMTIRDKVRARREDAQ
ncbi:MAG: hypothetical protein VR70_03780 [Rhodospirillaceae bacterium BRH_c57]|nr:MAG: hypothetical protein VR70_03780 [Rhodospirillaceae bacterium BRH_c57]